MSHDAIFVPRPIFGFAAIFATHLYAPNPPPIWPLINIKHHWIGCKNRGRGVKKGQRGVYLSAWLGVDVDLFGVILGSLTLYTRLLPTSVMGCGGLLNWAQRDVGCHRPLQIPLQEMIKIQNTNTIYLMQTRTTVAEGQPIKSANGLTASLIFLLFYKSQ